MQSRRIIARPGTQPEPDPLPTSGHPIWETDKVRIKKALDVIDSYGGIDGAHHKMWVLDQVVRILTGDGYDAWVERHKDGKDGPETCAWDEGIAP